MVKINPHFDKLRDSYVFSEIAKRTKEFSAKNPKIRILRLGIGTTTEALSSSIVKGLLMGVEKLSDRKTYTGYGDEQGDTRLRTALSDFYKKRGIAIDPLEVFISDGAKPDTANICSLFDSKSIIAVGDPVYPVYVDSNIMSGRTSIAYMKCTAKNGFIPNVPSKKVDVIFLCSPNNPTGAVMTKKQLTQFVEYAIKNNTVIIFDAAYSEFISDPTLPKSIYEISRAKECAIEISSFSKYAGFTGVRLGWTVVPKDLISENSEKGKLNSMWNRRQATMFNGASNIAQEGGLAALSAKGQKECQKIIAYYMKNAEIIKKGLETVGLTVFGGVNAPYLWVKTQKSMSSWEFFDKLLNQVHVVCTPGVGFGPEGEGYIRFSAFGHRENVEKAVESIQKNLVL